MDEGTWLVYEINQLEHSFEQHELYYQIYNLYIIQRVVDVGFWPNPFAIMI